MCEVAEFYTEKLVKARKPHKCCETRRMIQPGEMCWKIVGKWDGVVRTLYQTEAAYHFARYLNGQGPNGQAHRDVDDCIPFGDVGEFVREVGDPDLTAEWERVCAGEVTRNTTAKGGGGA